MGKIPIQLCHSGTYPPLLLRQGVLAIPAVEYLLTLTDAHARRNARRNKVRLNMGKIPSATRQTRNAQR